MSESYNESNIKQGRWTKEEQSLFNFAFQWHGKDWKKLSEIITTRNIVQIRSHAQKYCNRFKEKQIGESQVQKVYIVDKTLEALNQYISNTCAESYKKYIELQQSLLYAQIPVQYEAKIPENSIKIELNHN